MKRFLKKLLKIKGLRIASYHSPENSLLRRSLLFSHHNLKTVLDVGANVGQYAMSLRANGYNEKIISIEPVSSAFVELESNSSTDPKWDVYNFALGDKTGVGSINVTNDSVRSSILRPTGATVASQVKKIEEIQIFKLDDFIEHHVEERDLLLKLDAQGFEQNILNGAEKSLKRAISGIQLELSMGKDLQYVGEKSFIELSRFLIDLGFHAQYVEPGYFDQETGVMYQFDMIFFRDAPRSEM